MSHKLFLPSRTTNGDRADRHQLLQGPFDGVGGALVQPAGQQRPARLPPPGAVAVVQ